MIVIKLILKILKKKLKGKENFHFHPNIEI
jgi:hypothetical protein